MLKKIGMQAREEMEIQVGIF
nr:hypothetical protein [Sulfurihydrogenibium sp.]